MTTLLHTRAACINFHDLVVDFDGPRPRIVVLCGSTRFSEQYRQANLAETLAGRIVLSIGCDTRSDADLAAAGELGHGDLDATKAALDELHRRKIDLADEVLVVSDASGYYGDSTRGEIEYARGLGKPVRFLVEPPPRPPTAAALRNAAAIREVLGESAAVDPIGGDHG